MNIKLILERLTFHYLSTGQSDAITKLFSNKNLNSYW